MGVERVDEIAAMTATGKSKTKFASRNLSAVYKAPRAKPMDAGASAQTNGKLLVLGRSAVRGNGIVAKGPLIAAPTPINTPSLRKQNEKETGPLQPVGHSRAGWGASKVSAENEQPHGEESERDEEHGVVSDVCENQADADVKDTPKADRWRAFEPLDELVSTGSGRWGDEAVEEDIEKCARRSNDRCNHVPADERPDTQDKNNKDIRSSTTLSWRRTVSSETVPHATSSRNFRTASAPSFYNRGSNDDGHHSEPTNNGFHPMINDQLSGAHHPYHEAGDYHGQHFGYSAEQRCYSEYGFGRSVYGHIHNSGPRARPGYYYDSTEVYARGPEIRLPRMTKEEYLPTHSHSCNGNGSDFRGTENMWRHTSATPNENAWKRHAEQGQNIQAESSSSVAEKSSFRSNQDENPQSTLSSPSLQMNNVRILQRTGPKMLFDPKSGAMINVDEKKVDRRVHATKLNPSTPPTSSIQIFPRPESAVSVVEKEKEGASRTSETVDSERNDPADGSKRENYHSQASKKRVATNNYYKSYRAVPNRAKGQSGGVPDDHSFQKSERSLKQNSGGRHKASKIKLVYRPVSKSSSIKRNEKSKSDSMGSSSKPQNGKLVSACSNKSFKTSVRLQRKPAKQTEFNEPAIRSYKEALQRQVDETKTHVHHSKSTMKGIDVELLKQVSEGNGVVVLTDSQSGIEFEPETSDNAFETVKSRRSVLRERKQLRLAISPQASRRSNHQCPGIRVSRSTTKKRVRIGFPKARELESEESFKYKKTTKTKLVDTKSTSTQKEAIKHPPSRGKGDHMNSECSKPSQNTSNDAFRNVEKRAVTRKKKTKSFKHHNRKEACEEDSSSRCGNACQKGAPRRKMKYVLKSDSGVTQNSTASTPADDQDVPDISSVSTESTRSRSSSTEQKRKFNRAHSISSHSTHRNRTRNTRSSSSSKSSKPIPSAQASSRGKRTKMVYVAKAASLCQA